MKKLVNTEKFDVKPGGFIMMFNDKKMPVGVAEVVGVYRGRHYPSNRMGIKYQVNVQNSRGLWHVVDVWHENAKVMTPQEINQYLQIKNILGQKKGG